MMHNYRNIVAIPSLRDNYIWCLELESGTIVIDPGEASPVIQHLKKHNQTCIAILITHHHYDHIGGLSTLKNTYPDCVIYAPNHPDITTPHATITPTIKIDGHTFQVVDIPGHTLDHIAFYDGSNLFVGDTLFSAGCGRNFEGTYAQMLNSIDILNAYPPNTNIYCAHEYTLNNLSFAKLVEPDNLAIIEHLEYLNDKPITLPTTLKLERQINPFLRLNSTSIQSSIASKYSQPPMTRLETFEYLRGWKNQF